MWASIWGQKVLYVGSVYATIMDSIILVLYCAFASVCLRLSVVEATGTTRRYSRAIRDCFDIHDTTSLQLCISVSITEILAKPAEEYSDSFKFFSCFGGACDCKLAVSV